MRGRDRQNRLARIAEQVHQEQEAFLTGPMDVVHGMLRTGEKRAFDMTKWAVHGDFGRLMIEGFEGHYATTAPDTMKNAYKRLSQFMGGLKGVAALSLTEITLDHITSALATFTTPGAQHDCCGNVYACMRFMTDRAPDVRRPYVLDDRVKEHVHALAAGIKTHQDTLTSYFQARKRAPKDSSEGISGRVLNETDETIILAAAAAEINLSWQLHQEARELARTGTVHDLESFPDAATLPDCIATIDAAYSGQPWPTLTKERQRSKRGHVWRRLERLSKAESEVLLLRDALHFTSGLGLVPYVVALAWWSGWNTAPLQELNISGITGLPLDPYEQPRASDLVIMESVKHRKGGKTDASNRVSFDSRRAIHIEHDRILPPPAVLLQRIRCLTQRLRPHLRGHPLQDRLLIFGARGEVHGFGATGRRSSELVSDWRVSSSIGTGRSASRNPPLPAFTMRDLRKTVLGKYSERSLSLGRDIGQHTEATQRTFYLSEALHERSRARIAITMSSLENQAESRGRTQSGRPDLMGAVPGFDCEDPWASPIPTQANGKRCAAMQCPVCPNARIKPDDGPSCLHLFRRLEALTYEYKHLNTTPARRLVISKHIHGIEAFLALFTPKAIDWACKHGRGIGTVRDLGGVE